MELSKYKYDVVISFADEQKDAAISLSLALDKKGLSNYYYPHSQEENIGKVLKENLDSLYADEAMLAIGIMSKEYFQKKFTLIEFHAILKRLKTSPRYFIPIVYENQFIPKQIKGLTYFLWNSNPDQVAIIAYERIQKLIGELVNINSDNVSYMSTKDLLTNLSRIKRFTGFKNAKLHYALGLIYYYLNQSDTDLKLSVEHFEIAVSIKPSFHQALFGLSRSIISYKKLHKIRFGEIKEPIDYLIKAMKIHPLDKDYKEFARELNRKYFQKYGLKSPFINI